MRVGVNDESHKCSSRNSEFEELNHEIRERHEKDKEPVAAMLIRRTR